MKNQYEQHNSEGVPGAALRRMRNSLSFPAVKKRGVVVVIIQSGYDSQRRAIKRPWTHTIHSHCQIVPKFKLSAAHNHLVLK